MGKPTGFMEYERKTAAAVSPKERIKDFCEFHTPLSQEEQRKQAARCMNCGVPFCQAGMNIMGMTSGCPLHNLVPEWNDLVYTGNLEQAYNRLKKTNNFPEFTSRVCPALCEAACTCGHYGDPVSVKGNEYGIIENAYDDTYLIKGLSPEEIISEEPKLKEISYKTIAHLLFDKCDVLVVDKIGKNISGDGMDPNVSGRFVQPKYCSGGIQAEKCVILDLTDETHGNAQGIGLAEVTTRRLFNKMKLEMTYPTGVTNTFLHLMKIPMIMDNDREALQLALMCCPEAEDHDHMKMIRIPNTAHIGVIEISEGMLPLVENNPNFEVLTEPYDLPFDENGNLC